MPYLQTEAIPSKPKRRYFTSEQKTAIAREALVAGASVSRIARNHDVNTNQVFKWVREYRSASVDGECAKVKLLSVVVSDSAPDPAVDAVAAPKPSVQSGTIELHLARGRICLRGSVDIDVLGVVLDRLVS